VIASLLAFRDRKASSYPVAPETRLSSYVFKAAKVRALCEGIISGLRSSGSTRGKVGFWVLSRPSAGDMSESGQRATLATLLYQVSNASQTGRSASRLP
jgi:hypothetical protein